MKKMSDDLGPWHETAYLLHPITKSLGEKMTDPREVLRILSHPEKSDWCCYLFGGPDVGGSVIFTPAKGLEPNGFHRWMQSLCFGVKWVKK